MSQLATPALSAGASSISTRRWLLAVTLFLLACIPFLPAIHGQYTWDDNYWLVDNITVHAWNGLRIIWNPFAQGLHFYPVTFTALWAEHKLWSLDPTGYHAVNFLLHASSAVLLWLCLRRLRLRAAWLGALLWAIHPVQVDTVAWVAEQKNTLSGVLYFLAAWSYFRFERIGDGPVDDPEPLPRVWPFYALSLAAFTCALLSKTVTCTLPAALFLILWWKRGRINWRMIAPLIPFFIVGLGISAFCARQESKDMVAGGAAELHFSLLQRCFIASKDLWFYFLTLLFPYPLMAVYPRWTYSVSDPLNYLALVSIAGFYAGLFFLRRRIGFGPFIAFAFFAVTISPALGFINFYTMYYTFVADHYQYLACAGFLVFAAELLLCGVSALMHVDWRSTVDALASRAWRAHALTALFIALLIIPTAFYASLFATNLKMWSWAVEHNPQAYAAQGNLAAALADSGDLADADRHLALALKYGENDDSVQSVAGRLEMYEGRYGEAVEHFRRATEIRPSLPKFHTYLGDALMHLHRYSEAVEAYKKGAEIGNDDSSCYYGYALGLLKVHRDEDALAQFAKAVDVAPGNLIIRYDYANHLLDCGYPKKAIEQYLFILKYQQNSDAVWDNLAAAYYQDGQLALARAAKDKANALRAAAVPSASAPDLPASHPTP